MEVVPRIAIKISPMIGTVSIIEEITPLVKRECGEGVVQIFGGGVI
jgi:hypothetical protein